MGASLELVGGPVVRQVTPESIKENAVLTGGRKVGETIGQSISRQLKKIKKLPKPLRILASPTTTGNLITALGIVSGVGAGVTASRLAGSTGVRALASGVPTGIKTIIPAVLTGTSVKFGAGLLESSPTIGNLVGNKLLNPELSGQKIGGFIENPISTIKGAIRNAPVTSALIGTGLLAGGIAGGTYLYNKVKGIDFPTTPANQGNLTPDFTSEGSPTSQANPLTPETIAVTSGTPRKTGVRRARTKEKQSINIRVSPRINILNRASAVGVRNAKYLKQYAYV